MNTDTRSYDMSTRIRAKQKTRLRILQAAFELWREGQGEEPTLQEIADRSEVTVQTVLRHFGSKEGVYTAAIEEDVGGVQRNRASAPAGDVDAALDVLLRHYERDGDVVLKTLALESRVPLAGRIAAVGRASHREWCARVFGPFLPEGPDREVRLDAFVAATDLFVWKLFRQDLEYSIDRTRAAMHALIAGLIHSQP